MYKESANYYPIIFYTVLNYQYNCHQRFWKVVMAYFVRVCVNQC